MAFKYFPLFLSGNSTSSSNDDRVLNTKDFSTRGSLSRTKTLAVEPSAGIAAGGGFGGGGGANKWMRLRTLHLSTADALPPLPVKMAWVRNGLLILGKFCVDVITVILILVRHRRFAPIFN